MTLSNYTFAGGTAVVTGAASGMGRHLAVGLARRGSPLALVDRDADGLADVVAAISAMRPGLHVRSHVADLADPEQVARVGRDILRDNAEISLLINNAGVALGGTFDQVSEGDFDWVMSINFRAPVALTRVLLPHLSRAGHIVNVSSLFGLVAPAGQTAYASSKFALRGFSEALGAELRSVGIGVTTVHPGGIRTNIARNARVSDGLSPEEQAAAQRRFERLLTFPADRAAELILEAVRRRKRRLLIGASARIPDLIARIAPASFDRVERGLGRFALITRPLRRAGRPQ